MSDWRKEWRDSAVADDFGTVVLAFADGKQTDEQWDAIYKAVERIMENVEAEEREACAKVADEHSTWTRSFGAEKACEMVASSIRARGSKP